MQIVRGPVLTKRNLFNRARFRSGSAECADRMRHADDRMRGGRKQDIGEGRIVRMQERKGAGDKKGPGAGGGEAGVLGERSGCVSECCVLS